MGGGEEIKILFAEVNYLSYKDITVYCIFFFLTLERCLIYIPVLKCF